ADGAHTEGYVVATLPPGVVVNGVTTATNWLLTEGPQTIGPLTVPGRYTFHMICADPDSGHASTAMTFVVPGVPPTVLDVKAIVNGSASAAFDYPQPAVTHTDVTVHDADDIAVGWLAS